MIMIKNINTHNNENDKIIMWKYSDEIVHVYVILIKCFARYIFSIIVLDICFL